VFTDARYNRFPTLTGATPSVAGIVGNEWLDHDERRHITSVDDDATRLVGGSCPADACPPPR
jgi:hypothetical protein